MRRRRHRPVRMWLKPWKRRCSCGWGWFPCPDTVTNACPAVIDSLGLPHVDPPWNGPMARYALAPRSDQPPLMTRGQRWRSRHR
jgi:hypothetical protein